MINVSINTLNATLKSLKINNLQDKDANVVKKILVNKFPTTLHKKVFSFILNSPPNQLIILPIGTKYDTRKLNTKVNGMQISV